jgi:error-prone DNA polymerase
MYVELHARSAFSFLEGASAPEELASACSALGNRPWLCWIVTALWRTTILFPRINWHPRTYRTEVSCADGFRYPHITSAEAIKSLPFDYADEAPRSQGRRHRRAEFNILAAAWSVLLAAMKARWLIARTESRAQMSGTTLRHFRARQCFYQLHGTSIEEELNHAAIELARSLHFPLLATNGVYYACPRNAKSVFGLLAPSTY